MFYILGLEMTSKRPGRYLKRFLEAFSFVLTEYEPVGSHSDPIQVPGHWLHCTCISCIVLLKKTSTLLRAKTSAFLRAKTSALLGSQDICLVESQDICIVEIQDICLVETQDMCCVES